MSTNAQDLPMEKVADFLDIRWRDGILELKNGDEDFSEKGWKYMVENFKEFEGTKKIEFIFKDAEHITDDDLEQFCAALKEVSSFESISINFEGCENIADSGISDIAEALKALKNLQHFELYIGGELITDYSIEVLGEAAGESTSLRSLKLTFENCPDITDEGFGNFVNSVSQMKNLNAIGLGFHNCPQVTDYSLQTLFDNKAIMGAITGLGLDFKQSSLTKDGMQIIEHALS